MESRKITIRFPANQWAWADRKRREAIKEFGGAASVRYQKPKKPGDFHIIYVSEILNRNT